MVTLAELLAQSLEKAGSQGIERSAVMLLAADLFELGLAELHTKAQTQIPDALQTEWNARFTRLLEGEPPQYISGRASFWGIEFSVRPGILIPRPETEGLVALALEKAKEGMTVLDCGTGSGAIAIALKHSKPSLRVYATDISPIAVAVASSNAILNELDIAIYKADLFPAVDIRFDIIISNPPYVSEAEYQALNPMVKDYEPACALVSGAEGLDHISRILSLAPQKIKPGGMLFLEHGEQQRDKIIALAEKQAWRLEFAKEDLAGKARYLCFGIK